ncbi:MAG TPA: redoxin domain-containing protein [Thermoanaerobaculia bacterium]|nr:redoxin domain-containing protein [Thermoanaerobaculia bacterium]
MTTTSATSPLTVGDEAPNFDLSSTENALLMLRDEIIQNALVLYFFAELESDRTGRDLDALNGALDALARLRTRVLAVSPAKLDNLKKLQVERHLLFPLLHDDRDFSARYGVTCEAGENQPPAPPALVVVSRKQRVLWLANPVVAVADALPQVQKLLKALPSPTASYPKSVINRFIDRWVN